FASNIVNGLAVAASSYTGRFLGAQKPWLAEEYSKQISRMGLMFSIVMGSGFVLAGGPIARIYTSDITVIGLVALVLKIATLIIVPQNYLAIISGSLRGAGDTKWPLVSSVIGMVVARVSLAAIFVRVFHWGLPGAWMAAVADQSIRSVLIYYRFKTGKWKQIEV
ncbi:MAG TPA: MATE family efflux transporter, partial [Bacillota bacterium]|nr:MATE family efflux transporter [Bacillota bacterium]